MNKQQAIKLARSVTAQLIQQALDVGLAESLAQTPANASRVYEAFKLLQDELRKRGEKESNGES